MCTVERREHDWVFSFGEDATLSVEGPWRIVTAKGIGFASADDGQLFGLPKPIDGESVSNELLKERRVIQFQVDVPTADVRIAFEDDTRVEVYNHSSGDECWSLGIQAEGKGVLVVGLGGGDVTIFSS